MICVQGDTLEAIGTNKIQKIRILSRHIMQVWMCSNPSKIRVHMLNDFVFTNLPKSKILIKVGKTKHTQEDEFLITNVTNLF